jgi:phosphoserine phosphatase RsbU/P
MPTATPPSRKTGLAFKLTLCILSGAMLIFCAAFAYNYHYSKELILKNVRERAKNLTDSALYRIESVIDDGEQVPGFLAYILETAPPDDDHLKQYLKDFVKASPSVFGSTAAFEPYSFDAREKLYAPYYYKSGDFLEYSLLGQHDNYDYLRMDWYVIPKELGKPVWSEPYYDEGGGDIVMSTYSAPFYRKLGGARLFWGVVTADISLEWLQKFVSDLRIYDSGQAFLLSRNGVFVSAPNKERIMRESIFSLAEDLNAPDIRALGKKMTAGEEGFVHLPEKLFEKPSWLYYAPMPSTGWSLGVIVPEDELFAELHGLVREVIVIVAVGFALLLAVILSISTAITRPIKLLASKTAEIAKGNLDVSLPQSGRRDEVGDLTRSFDDMRVALKEYIADLTETTKAKERMESELKIARTIQMSFLPKRFPPFPHIEAFELHAALEPAWEVGGDLYDFFLLDDRHLFFSVGDVSGKGVPAALFMAVTKTLVKGIAEQDMDPSVILSKVNQELCIDNESMLFVTMFCAILDIASGDLAFSNAGHNPPLVIPASGEPSWLELPKATFLGVIPEMAYKTAWTKLNPGDKLFVYTDGVTEAMDRQDRLYSSDRLFAEAEKLRKASAEDFDAGIMKSVHEYADGAPPADDVTVLTLLYKGEKS